MTLQEIVFALQRFWSERGCLIQQPYDAEVGAGTMHPETFLRVLGPAPWKVGYVQPSRRPADGRYGENPNRLYKHQQFQVILKPLPADIQDVYLGSLEASGSIPPRTTSASRRTTGSRRRSAPGASAGRSCSTAMEITQFTYFQQAGGIDLAPISGEITYGLERIAMYLQDVDDVYQLRWSADTLYRDVRHEEEYQLSRYSFELADVELHRRTSTAPWPRAGGSSRPRAAARTCPPTTGPEELARLQRPRRPGRHLGHRAGGHDPGIRKLACAIAVACVDAAAAGRGGRGRACLSSSSRWAARRCPRPGSPA